MKYPEFALFTGLPRTGSTIVKAILNQNPQIYASKNSPMCNTMWNFPDLLVNNTAYTASPNEQGLHRIMQNMMPLYYQEKLSNKKIIFDKGFSWGAPANYNMIKKALGYNPRYLVTTRNFDDVVDSLVRLVKKYPGTNVFCKNMVVDPKLSFRDRLIFSAVYAVWGTIAFILMCINFYWSLLFGVGTLILVILGKREIERKYVKKT